MSSKKPFSFKSSALSVAADQLWSASKKEFKAGDTSVKLDLGKTLGEKSEPAARPAETTKNTGFVFGSKITERVIVDNKVTNVVCFFCGLKFFLQFLFNLSYCLLLLLSDEFPIWPRALTFS